MLKRLMQEPLIHFMLLALVIFGAYAILSPQRDRTQEQILITAGRFDQIASLFAKTWQRQPTAVELKGLVDDYVKEEVYYREAKALGLDTDDTVIRRRLRSKMEFLNESAVQALSPSEAELQAYLDAHGPKFELDALTSFQQIFLNPDRRGNKIEDDAAAILQILWTNPAIDPQTLGDASLLPFELPLTAKTSIGQTFGAEFASSLDTVALGRWTGPLRSGFGFHIVRVAERTPGRTPALREVRGEVVREWSNHKRKELEDSRLQELLKRYEVTIERLPAAPAPK